MLRTRSEGAERTERRGKERGRESVSGRLCCKKRSAKRKGGQGAGACARKRAALMQGRCWRLRVSACAWKSGVGELAVRFGEARERAREAVQAVGAHFAALRFFLGGRGRKGAPDGPRPFVCVRGATPESEPEKKNRQTAKHGLPWRKAAPSELAARRSGRRIRFCWSCRARCGSCAAPCS